MQQSIKSKNLTVCVDPIARTFRLGRCASHRPSACYQDKEIASSEVLNAPDSGMSAGLATVLGTDRQYLLFDSFEGLPAAKEIDGRAALSWQNEKQSPT